MQTHVSAQVLEWGRVRPLDLFPAQSLYHNVTVESRSFDAREYVLTVAFGRLQGAMPEVRIVNVPTLARVWMRSLAL